MKTEFRSVGLPFHFTFRPVPPVQYLNHSGKPQHADSVHSGCSIRIMKYRLRHLQRITTHNTMTENFKQIQVAPEEASPTLLSVCFSFLNFSHQYSYCKLQWRKPHICPEHKTLLYYNFLISLERGSTAESRVSV